jgi:CubicO group peptidase (beta-lactamase class C family)
MTRIALFIAAFVFAIWPIACRGDDRFAGMDEYVRDAMKRWEVPGLAIAVVKDGQLVLSRGYGLCEAGKQRKVTSETVFPIASCDKSFTAAAIAILVDEGKLAWDDPVIKHLPDFELADPYLTKNVTICDILSHRTGLRRCDLLCDRSDFDSREIVRRLKHIEPVAPLRTKFTYNNHMFVTANELVARVSGQPWDQFVHERIFKPLEMQSTTTDALHVPTDRLALRHWRRDGQVVTRSTDTDGRTALSGVYSNVTDSAQWLKLHLAEGQFEGRRLLSEKSIREMHAMHFSIPVTIQRVNIYTATFHGTGLGWQVLDYRGRKMIRHGGAWGAWMAMIPEEKLGVVVLSNLDLNGLVGMLMYDLFDAYLVGPEVAWDRTKWPAWLSHEGPGYAYRPRDEAKSRLEKTRAHGTKPSRPLSAYSGTYESKLYGPLIVRHDAGRLTLTFGDVTTEMSHWQDELFYVRAPTRLTFDWLLTFDTADNGPPRQLTVKHIGWDKDEKDHVYSRQKQTTD